MSDLPKKRLSMNRRRSDSSTTSDIVPHMGALNLNLSPGGDKVAERHLSLRHRASIGSPGPSSHGGEPGSDVRTASASGSDPLRSDSSDWLISTSSRSVSNGHPGPDLDSAAGDGWEAVRASLGKKASSLHSPMLASHHSHGLDNIQERAGHLVAFVIPSKFFSDAHRESQNVSAPDPQMLDSHLFTPSAAVIGKDGKRGCKIVPETHWRRRLISPLVGFLTDVKNKAEWIQLAGHVGSFLPGRGGVICKKVGDREKQCYERLMDEQEPLRDFVPLYFKEVELMQGEWYLELEDLLANFANPNVMDVKMGVRTFLETEVTKTTLRMDLLEKMMALDPTEPTMEEKKEGITKLRYMEFREVKSSSRNLGFRIEGIKRSNEKPRTDFKKVHSTDEAASAIETFLPEKGSPLRAVVMTAFMERLEDLSEALDRSDFFSHHECIGSSLLFLYDQTGEAGIWMIDFGKTDKVEKDMKHDVEWVLGTREDGYLLGMHNLTDILQASSPPQNL